MRCINRAPSKTTWFFYNSDDALANPKHILHVSRSSRAKGHCEAWDTKDISSGGGSAYIEVQAGESVYALGQPFKLNINTHSYPLALKSDSVALFNGSKVIEIGSEADALLTLGGWELSSRGSHAPTHDTLQTLHAVSDFSVAIVDALIAGYANESVGLGGAKLGVGVFNVFLGMLRENRMPQALSIAEFKSAMNEVLDERDADNYAATIMGATEWFGGWASRVASLNASGATEMSTDDLGEFRNELESYTDGNSGSTFQEALTQLDHNPKIRVLALPEYIMGLSLDIHLERLKLLLKEADGHEVTVHDVNDLSTRVTRYRDWLLDSEADLTQKVRDLHKKYPFGILTETHSGNRTTILKSYARPATSTYGEASFGYELQALMHGCVRRYLAGDANLIDKAIDGLNRLLQEIENTPVN